MIPNLTDEERILFNPKRFVIATVLYIHGEMNMSTLQRLTGLSWGDLASNLSLMERRGIVKIRKVLTQKGPRTRVTLTRRGLEAYESLALKLEAVLRNTHKSRRDRTIHDT